MLKRMSRLTKDRMAGIFRTGRRVAQGPWLLVFQSSGETRASRFAFVAPAKTFPDAYARHRAKRIAREIVRTHLDRFLPGYDIVVMYRFPPERWDFQELSDSLGALFVKQSLLKG